MRRDHGLSGGTIRRPEIMAEHLAGRALRLMKGESAGTIPVNEVDPLPISSTDGSSNDGTISEARLPANSTIPFKQHGVWELYRAYIRSGAVVLMVQTALSVSAVVQRCRRRTEHALRQSYEQNQDLAGRLINVQEDECARIARDLCDDLSRQLSRAWASC